MFYFLSWLVCCLVSWKARRATPETRVALACGEWKARRSAWLGGRRGLVALLKYDTVSFLVFLGLGYFAAIFCLNFSWSAEHSAAGMSQRLPR